MSDNAIIPTSDQLPANMDADAKAILQEHGLVITAREKMILRANMEGNGDLTYRDLPTIHVPGAGGSYFELPEGPSESFDCIILNARKWARRLYKTTYNPAEVTPPDCYSNDMLTGIGDPGGSCIGCPFNEFGSAIASDGEPGRGKGCGEHRYLFVHRPDCGPIPQVLAVPPTSLKAVKNYLVSLTSAPYYACVTRVGLQKTTSPVSSLTFRMVEVLPFDTWAFLESRSGAIDVTFKDADLAQTV